MLIVCWRSGHLFIHCTNSGEVEHVPPKENEIYLNNKATNNGWAFLYEPFSQKSNHLSACAELHMNSLTIHEKRLPRSKRVLNVVKYHLETQTSVNCTETRM